MSEFAPSTTSNSSNCICFHECRGLSFKAAFRAHRDVMSPCRASPNSPSLFPTAGTVLIPIQAIERCVPFLPCLPIAWHAQLHHLIGTGLQTSCLAMLPLAPTDPTSLLCAPVSDGPNPMSCSCSWGRRQRVVSSVLIIIQAHFLYLVKRIFCNTCLMCKQSY